MKFKWWKAIAVLHYVREIVAVFMSSEYIWGMSKWLTIYIIYSEAAAFSRFILCNMYTYEPNHHHYHHQLKMKNASIVLDSFAKRYI